MKLALKKQIDRHMSM